MRRPEIGGAPVGDGSVAPLGELAFFMTEVVDRLTRHAGVAAAAFDVMALAALPEGWATFARVRNVVKAVGTAATRAGCIH